MLRSIAVAPGHQGRGIGKKIALDVLERARRFGANLSPLQGDGPPAPQQGSQATGQSEAAG
ncbi:GNAT family N-acetyltransferase [Rhizobium ruizarguesonis]|uniref:GNAT family N-acetyltransferase n=1 Tax=Rhizobium ruizarguesonis TaxID=2081791 RepID=UPI0037CAC5A9